MKQKVCNFAFWLVLTIALSYVAGFVGCELLGHWYGAVTLFWCLMIVAISGRLCVAAALNCAK